MTAAISQIELFGKFDESVVTQSNVLGFNKTVFSIVFSSELILILVVPSLLTFTLLEIATLTTMQ